MDERIREMIEKMTVKLPDGFTETYVKLSDYATLTARLDAVTGEINKWFEEGMSAFRDDRENHDPMPESPYPVNSIARHWWTRGYAYMARNIYRIKAENDLATLRAQLSRTEESLHLERKAVATLISAAGLPAETPITQTANKIHNAIMELAHAKAQVAELRDELNSAQAQSIKNYHLYARTHDDLSGALDKLAALSEIETTK